MNSNLLIKLSKISVFAALFSVVFVDPVTFFPFIGVKYYFFRIATEIALALLVIWWGFFDKSGEIIKRLKEVVKSPLFITVSAFVLVYLLASIFAYDPLAAFWSNYERGEGGFQMIHYYMFFCLLLMFMKNEADWRWVFKLSLIAAALLILYGVFAQLGVGKFISPYRGEVPDTVIEKLTATRFQGSLGNPAYVAPYLMFAIFYASYLLATLKTKIKSNKILFTIAYWVSIVSSLLFFTASQTRGAFLGLIAAVGFFLVLMVLEKGIIRKWGLIALVGVVVLGGILFAMRSSPVITKSPIGRLFDVNIGERAFQTRLWTWGSAAKGFLDRPILGWGQENFGLVFDKYFDSRHYIPGANTETWFDRAHSVFFDYLAETGVLGLLSYLAIFAAFFWQFFKKFFQKKIPLADSISENKNAVLKGLFGSIVIAYLVQALALFDVLPIYINLFLFLAFCVYKLGSEESDRSIKHPS